MLRKFLNLLIVCAALLTPLRAEAERKQPIRTHLYGLEQYVIEVGPFRSSGGGAIEPFGSGLLLVTPQGRLAHITRLGVTTYLGGTDVPMNRTLLGAHEIRKNPTFSIHHFRIGDLLLKERGGKLEVYVSHHYFTGECMEFRISATTLELENGHISSSPLHWRTIFKAVPCIRFQEHGSAFPGYHIGGRMLWDGEGHILVVIGDHQLDGVPQEEPKISLDPHSHLGKLVRVDVKTGIGVILARGLRVPQGLVRDAKGNLWETEHGPQGGDELNLLIPGLNYGWPDATYGIDYQSKRWPHAEIQGRHPDVAWPLYGWILHMLGYYGWSGKIWDEPTRPAYAWIPSIGISAVMVSHSEKFPLWKGDLLIASLKSKSLFRTRLSENRVVYTEQIEIGWNIRDVTQIQDGSIALLLDEGQVLVLTPYLGFCAEGFRKDHIYTVGDCTPRGKNSLFEMTLLSGPPIIRSGWDVYVHGREIIYYKNPCTTGDTSLPFFLHVFPEKENNLPDHREQYGFDNLDFLFESKGLRAKEMCVVARNLPDYDISMIRTGQSYNDGERRWTGEYRSGNIYE